MKAMKKLIVIGNKKEVSDKFCDYIDNTFDKIARLNRMMSYGKTGYRTDFLMVDLHNEFFKLIEKPYDKYNNAKQLFVNTDQPLINKIKAIRLGIFSTSQFANAIDISSKRIAQPLVGENNFFISKNMPTNFFLFTKYLVDNYSHEYEIWIAGVDLHNRDYLFNNMPEYQHSWHTNIGKFESDYLTTQISNNKIKYLNINI